uniref:UDP-N-acetylglucosamine--peptide N-acetylglucosaminyltransferase SPINDLY n=1 Tax=Strongyloides stercoralis TaxID=6248 RepID=A0AAF5CVI6_STRER
MAETTLNGNGLMIPKRYGGGVIEYTTSTLPEVDIIISELLGEHCRISLWYDFALAYYRQKRYDDFQAILEKGIEYGQKEHDGTSTDILKLYDALASYQILCGCKETEKVKKAQHFSKATTYFNAGDKILMFDQDHLLGRAYFCLYEGLKMDQAEAQFKFVINTNEKNVPAILGYACVLYNKKEYKKSLEMYKKVLRMCPNSPPYVRLGIGYCLHKLGYIEKARVAFERVLELEGNNSHALTALAVLDFNKNTLESTSAAAKRLVRSWKEDNKNSVTALEMANFLFLRTDYAKSEKYANIALHLIESPRLKAEGHYMVGRCLHQKGETDLAIRHYNIAINSYGSKYLQPLFGLGQLFVKNKEFEKAIECFEKVLADAPNDVNTKKALIMMYIRCPGKNFDIKNKRTISAKKYFSELLTGENLLDATLIAEHARFLEKTNISLALKEIARIVDMYKETGNNFIPIELYNNLGVYLYMNKIYIEANAVFSECLNRLEEERSKDTYYANNLELTLTFNLARTKEELGYCNDAIELYKCLLKWKPNYYEATLRLGKIAQKRGDSRVASKYYEEVISRDPKNFEALTLLGCLYMERKDYKQAQKKFDDIIKLPEHKSNAFACFALGTIWLEQLYIPNRNKEKDEQHVMRAFDMYSKVIRYHPKNVYAANCIAILLAFNGNFEEARECFAEVRENLFDKKDAWLNLAHVYGMLKNYLNSTQMFKAAIEKFGLNNDCDVLMALARIYWKNDDYFNAKEYMVQAVDADCCNFYARYNLARIYMKIGLKIMESTKSSLTDLDNAIGYFTEARDVYNVIYQLLINNEMKYKWKYINREMAKEEASKCEDYLIQANLSRTKAIEFEREKEECKIKQKEMMLKLEEERIAEKKNKEEKDLERLKRLRELRNEYLNMTKDALKIPTVEEKKKSNSRKEGGGSRRKKSDVNDGFIISEEEFEEENRRRKQKRKSKKNRKEQESQIENSESENEEKKQEDEEDINNKQKGKYKSKAYISSDSDSSENEKKEEENKRESLSPPVPTYTGISSDSDDSTNSSSN